MRLEVARKTRHYFNGRHAWSPEWKLKKDKILLWQLCLKRFNPDCKTQPRFLRRMMRRCKEPEALTLSKDQVTDKLEHAKLEFESACTRDEALRSEFLKNLAKAIAEKNDTSEESELKKLSHISRQKRRAARIRRARGAPSKGLATKLLETKPDGSQVMVEDQENLIRVTAAENCRRFTTCYECVFLQEQALQEIGLLADGPAVPQILAGTWQPPEDWEDAAVDFVQALQTPPAIAGKSMGPTTISTKNHQKGWQRQRPPTAGEPTALDFSAHIAASYDDLLAEIDATL